jgi:hypothetical protein
VSQDATDDIQGIARVVESAYMASTDRPVVDLEPGVLGDAGVKLRVALDLLCETQARDPGGVALEIAEIAKIDNGRALEMLAGAAITELHELGYREQIEAEMAEVDREEEAELADHA